MSMLTRRCRICGVYLEADEWCDCESHDAPEIEMTKRPAPKARRKSYEQLESEYNDQLWQEYDLP